MNSHFPSDKDAIKFVITTIFILGIIVIIANYLKPYLETN